MSIYSFDVKSISKNDENLFDIFEKNIEYSTTIPLHKYFIPREFEMRLDLISKELYGSSRYIEELMVINNIMNPYSLKENQMIYYCTINDMQALYIKDDMKENDKIRESIIKSSQTNKKSQQRDKIPTTLRSKNVKQVTIDSKNRKIKIMNTFK